MSKAKPVNVDPRRILLHGLLNAKNNGQSALDAKTVGRLKRQTRKK